MTSRGLKDLPDVTLPEIQQRVKQLLNKKVAITNHLRGRDAVSKGVITAVYKNLFVVEFTKKDDTYTKTFTYSDLISEEIIVEEVVE